MKQKEMKKKKNGKNTKPCLVLMVETIAKVEKVVIRDLSGETCLSYDAEKEMKSLKGKLSQNTQDLISDLLLGFSPYMQKELAEDIVIFANEHIVHTTGCASADRALETAYIAIACEQGCYSDRLTKMWEAAGV